MEGPLSEGLPLTFRMSEDYIAGMILFCVSLMAVMFLVHTAPPPPPGSLSSLRREASFPLLYWMAEGLCGLFLLLCIRDYISPATLLQVTAEGLRIGPRRELIPWQDLGPVEVVQLRAAKGSRACLRFEARGAKAEELRRSKAAKGMPKAYPPSLYCEAAHFGCPASEVIEAIEAHRPAPSHCPAADLPARCEMQPKP